MPRRPFARATGFGSSPCQAHLRLFDADGNRVAYDGGRGMSAASRAGGSRRSLPLPAPGRRSIVTRSASRRTAAACSMPTGGPFLIQGDAAWSLIANPTVDEARRYLDDRRALKGSTPSSST